jgi:hypothetical protein
METKIKKEKNQINAESLDEVDENNKKYIVYKSKEEAEYESKMATQNALVQLGKILNQKDIITQNQKDLHFLLNDLYESYEINGSDLEELYKIPILVMDKYFEKNVSENEHLSIMKSKEQKIIFYKMLLFVYMLKEEINEKNKTIESLEEVNDELNNNLEENIQEIEDYEKELKNKEVLLQNEKSGSPYKEELEIIKKESNELAYENYFMSEFIKVIFLLYILIVTLFFIYK